MPSSAERERHDYLDSLRGIAILGVVLVHAAILTKQVDPIWMYAFTGQRGVQLFYIISAFTLCLSLDGRRPEHYPLSNYFLRRFFRIAPLFYLAIVMNVVATHYAPELTLNPPIGVWDVLSGVLFLNGLRPHMINNVALGGWSIAVETTFYLILPWLYRYLNSVRRAALAFSVCALVLGLLSWQIALQMPDPELEQYFAFLWFPVELPVFLLGILAYRIWQQYLRNNLALQPYRKELSLVLLIGAALIYQGCLPFEDWKLYGSSFLFLPLLLSLALYPRRLFVNPLTRYIGKISYSLYLLHFFALVASRWVLNYLETQHWQFATRRVYGHWSGWLAAFLGILLASLPICALSWKLIEQPGIQLGRKIIALREGWADRSQQPVGVSSSDAQV